MNERELLDHIEELESMLLDAHATIQRLNMKLRQIRDTPQSSESYLRDLAEEALMSAR